MSIISQETWDNMPKEEKDKIIKKYNWYQEKEVEEAILEFENLFGKENLQPKLKIRTWSDVEKIKNSYKNMVSYLLNFSKDIRLNKKLAATFQIKLLIELGYGGMVSEEEWEENGHDKGFYSLWADAKGKIECTLVYDSKEFIAFHTKEQADEFMSYPENIELVEQYFMA